MARRPHHRSIWRMTDERSRAYHTGKLQAAIRVLVQLVRSLLMRSAGLYAIDPALVIKARDAADLAESYLDTELAGE